MADISKVTQYFPFCLFLVSMCNFTWLLFRYCAPSSSLLLRSHCFFHWQTDMQIADVRHSL